MSMLHNKATVYRKMRMNAQVLPAELVIVIKDIDQRLLALEKGNTNETGMEEPKSTGRRLSKVSKKKVPAS